MDGIHIVAFAEEEDPGLCLYLLVFGSCFPFFFEAELRFCLLCPTVPRRLRVPGDPERRGQRQHKQPGAQHRLDRP